eukprot:13907198-Alexandrium_andersonii.AAC.1
MASRTAAKDWGHSRGPTRKSICCMLMRWLCGKNVARSSRAPSGNVFRNLPPKEPSWTAK